jgi:hypothetical protein
MKMEFRMAHTASTQQMTFQVQDTEGHTYNVLIRVDEKAAQGTLIITDSVAGEAQQYELTQLQKSRNGKTLGFKSSGATVTLTIEDAHTPPRLHLVARIFVPVVDTTYTLSQAEQERFVAWINMLNLGVLS